MAAVQLGPQGEDRAANLIVAANLIRSIQPKPNFVILPELFSLPFWCVGLHDRRFFDWAERLDGPTITAISDVARSIGTYVVAPFFERGLTEGEYYNSAVLIDPDGEIVHGRLPDGREITTYRKNAISSYAWDGHVNDEKWYFRVGDGFPIFETTIGRVGLLICYDRWYPEAWRVLALQGAVAVFVVNASEGFVSDMLVPSMRTCAAQNVLYVGCVNRAGVEQVGGVKTEYYGRTCIMGPRGDVLAEANGADPNVVIAADVDMDRVAEDRRRLWVFRDRRPELYRLLVAPRADPDP